MTPRRPWLEADDPGVAPAAVAVAETPRPSWCSRRPAMPGLRGSKASG